MEIERKWILNGFPKDLKQIREAYIKQGYLSINPEVRIRKYIEEDHVDYLLCIKGEGELSRTEVETYIESWQYEDILEIIDKPMISKIYKKYELGNGLVLECSLVDSGTENQFYYAEVEFESEEEAKSFEPTFETVLEVTYDKDYKMKNIWLETRLKSN